jgi:putative membrane protein
MVAREIIIRKNIINIEAWRNFFIVCFCLGFSAFYELIEWWVAILSNDSANDFLGTQGYIWDTQSDMAWALFSSIIALILLRKYHDNHAGMNYAVKLYREGNMTVKEICQITNISRASLYRKLAIV